MSIAEPQTVTEELRNSKLLFDASAVIAAEQLSLLQEPITAGEMVAARRVLPEGTSADHIGLVRESRRGRPLGARNKYGDDFKRYIAQFGSDSAVTLKQIQSSTPEMLMEASKRKVTRITKNGSVVEIEESMSYEAALGMIVRCAAELMPYEHRKQAVAIDATIRHDGDLIIAGMTHSSEEVQGIIEADFAEVESVQPDWDDDEAAT